eukprot:6904178-Pyramimonas_sp.AAC.1
MCIRDSAWRVPPGSLCKVISSPETKRSSCFIAFAPRETARCSGRAQLTAAGMWEKMVSPETCWRYAWERQPGG